MAKKIFVLACVAVFCLVSAYSSYAADNPGQTLKQELNADRQAIKSQKAEIKSNGQAARAEEKNLKDQIRTARTSGDKETANELKGQLKATHKENVLEKRNDKMELRSAKKELKLDKKAGKGPKGK